MDKDLIRAIESISEAAKVTPRSAGISSNNKIMVVGKGGATFWHKSEIKGGFRDGLVLPEGTKIRLLQCDLSSDGMDVYYVDGKIGEIAITEMKEYEI